MMQDKLSCREVARQFEIDHKCVCDWEQIYLAEGPEVLYVECRGSKGRPQSFPKEVEEDLLTEVQRLRAEKSYIYLRFSIRTVEIL